MNTIRAVLAAVMSLAATALHAHDSWLVEQDGNVGIVTGIRFPRADLVPPPESIAQRDCTTSGAARACWIELRAFDITLDAKIVDVYFREAHPPDAVVAQWRAMHANGKEWRERYRKFARIELAASGATPNELHAIRKPANLDLEVLPVGDAAFHAGSTARFVVVSKGEPVANQPVELVSDLNPLGLWSRTNEHGEVEWRLPFAAHWLARTILLERDGDDRFRSRFATFAFEAR